MAGSDSARAISLDRSSMWRSLSNSIATHCALRGHRSTGMAARPRGRRRLEGRRPGRVWIKEKAGGNGVPPAWKRALGAGSHRLAPVLLLEPLDATRGVHELVLSGVERMALRAHFDVDVGSSGAGANHLSARTRDGRVHIVRMNAHLHCRHPLKVTKDTTPVKRRKTGAGPGPSPSNASRPGTPCWSW